MTTPTLIEGGDTVRLSLPGLFADRMEGTQLAHDIRAGRTVTDEFELAEVWRTRRRVRAGKGYRVEIEAGPCDLEDLIDYAEAFEIGAEQGEEHSEARACRVAIERLREARRLFDEVVDARP